jgi:DNA (cytosine-5)-methyltransferase 1
MGYHRAGFDVVGVDIKPQPRYPFEFHQVDAMTFPLDGFDVVHASPPCQAYSEQTPVEHRTKHLKLIPAVRSRMSGVPFVIENVEGARRDLVAPTLMLCGTMFGLNLWRHRYFEIGNFPVFFPPATCNHSRRPVTTHAGSNTRRLGPVAPTGTTRRKSGRFEWSVQDCRDAMEIPWMTREGIDQAIPPAYTEFIGRQLIAAIEAVA